MPVIATQKNSRLQPLDAEHTGCAQFKAFVAVLDVTLFLNTLAESAICIIHALEEK